MYLPNDLHRPASLILCLALVLAACGDGQPAQDGPARGATRAPTATTTDRLPAPAELETPTPTPTAAPLPAATISAPSPSRCEGLAGQLEVQVLVGPAEAVGLEPVAVGNVPFSVTSSAPPYLVQGQGPISYEATLEREWGTYAVTMDTEAAVAGACGGEPGHEQLEMSLDMTGEQQVVVDAEGFHGEYPWSGTQTLDLAFPLEEGATAQGEGWAVVLHLGSP